MLLTASSPKFVCKDIGSGAVAARRVGNVFHDRGFADVFLRHLMQTGGSHAHDDEPLQCDIQLQGCQLGHMLLEHPKMVAEDIQLQGCQQGHMLPEHPMWPVAEDIVRNPDVSAWKSALYDGLRSADGFHVLTVDGTMNIAKGVPPARRGDALKPWQLQEHVGHNTCVLTTRTLQGAVLDLAVVPGDSKPHCCRVRPQERGAPRRSGGCALCSRGQRIAGVTRRPVVVVSTSSGRRAGHVPSPDEVRDHTLAHRILIGFCCSQELHRHVEQSVQKFLTNAHFRLRRHVGQWSRSPRCMHTLWCLLVSADVPRMRLCSSLSDV